MANSAGDRILVLGGGGREHALCDALARSAAIGKIFCAPGNYGISAVAERPALNPLDPQAVVAFCQKEKIDFVVIGPEAPAEAGVGDALDKAGIAYFGPTQAAARLETSKGFTKDLCGAAHIPTARYARYDNADAALKETDRFGFPVVIKADGLAAGKGVIIAQDKDEAGKAIRFMFDGAFGTAGAEIVVEEFLQGEEASFFALCDGEKAIPFASARDYKRVYDHDEGPNTGGMGAFSPSPLLDAAMTERVMREIIEPTLAEMRKRGAPFKGVLYAGLMLTETGPKLIEYNVRFGDPECQVMMKRLKSDLYAILRACAAGFKADMSIDFDPRPAVTIVYAAKGYPEAPEKGALVTLPDNLPEDVTIFHAGTEEKDGNIVTTGGRALNITASGDTVRDAAEKAYAALKTVKIENGFYRSDIGFTFRENPTLPSGKAQEHDAA